jgi:hypothetical protein
MKDVIDKKAKEEMTRERLDTNISIMSKGDIKKEKLR